MSHVDPDARRAYKREWYARHAEQERERRRSYRGTCERCGGETSSGHGHAKVPRYCDPCRRILDEPPHGVYTRYSSVKWRCRCDQCRAAWNAYMREWYARGRMA